MKKTFTFAMALAALALLGANANAQQYALHLGETTYANGDTAVYTPQDWEYDLNQTVCNILIENLTDGVLNTTQEATVVSGPQGQHLEICAGGNCPWNGQPYDLEPGLNSEKPITLELSLDKSYTGESLVKVVVGNSPELGNSTTLYVRVVYDKSAIAGAEMPQAVRAYPNPTRSKVTVGDKVYDLSGRPAGVYVLPTEKGMVSVIKL